MNDNLKKYSFLAASLLLLAPLSATAADGQGAGASLEVQQQAKKSVTGTVVDENGEPVIGANIVQKNVNNNGTVTDLDGKFTISVPQGASLNISYIGYKTQTVAARSGLTYRLEPDAKNLEEVVVVGYGTQKKKDLTGSISQIDSKLIEQQNGSSASKALEGSVPGLTYASADGQPGTDAAIRLRGVGSTTVNASAALIIIDGVPATGDDPLSKINQQDIATITVLKDAASTAIYGSRGANGVVLVTTKSGQSGKTKISFQGRWGVNTTGTYDVGQVNTAAGIYEYEWQSIYNSYRYGVNGTGGPVMGPNGEYITNVKNPNYSHEQAAQFASAHLFNYVGSETSFGRNQLGNYMAYNVPGAVYTPDGAKSSTMSGAYLVNPDGRLNPAATLIYDDTYKDALLTNGFHQEYNLSAQGGSEKTTYFMSLGFLKDPSYIPNSRFERLNGRMKIDSKLFSWLKVGMNVAYSRATNTYIGSYYQSRVSGSNPGSIMRYVNGHTPIFPVHAYDANGNMVIDEATGQPVYNYREGDTYSPLGVSGSNYNSNNIVYAMNNDRRITRSSSLNTRTYAEISFLKHFTLRTDLAYDKINTNQTLYYNGDTGRAVSLKGVFGKKMSEIQSMNIQNRLTYSQDFGQHHVDAMGLYEESDWRYENVNWSSSDELIPGFLAAGNFVGKYVGAGQASTPGYGHDIERMRSWLARANYVFADKYYASASFRTDGSSKFKKDRWGKFWSVGAGWRFSEESFMKDMKSWLDSGKLRVSYGKIGNQNAIARYSGYRTWGYSTGYKQATNGNGVPTQDSYKVSPGGLVNDKLTWEETRTFDVGLDLSLFNRVSVTLDYYNRLTGNSFFNQPVSYLAVGQQTLQQNTAKLRNRGVELDINADIIRNKDWRWNLAFNISHYTTVLTYVPEEALPEATAGDPKGTWRASCDGWSASGEPSQVADFYLRGVGKDWYNIYVYKTAGVDQNTGLPLYYTRDEQGNVSTTNNYAKATRFECGSAIPDVVGGFNTTISYKNWSLSGQFAYQIGGKFFGMEYAEYLYAPTSASMYRMMFVSQDVAGNTWTPERTGAEFPMQWYSTDNNVYFDGTSTKGGSWEFTDKCLFSASYLKVKNITLNYTVPASFLRKIHLGVVSNLRLFAAADNLWLISAHKGIDPSMSATGGYNIGSYGMPNMRAFTFGLNVEL